MRKIINNPAKLAPKTIYCGHKAFETLLNAFKSDPNIREQYVYGGIEIIKQTLLEPTSIVTGDPDLIEMLKELEECKNETNQNL